jgi:hypothetical protein
MGTVPRFIKRAEADYWAGRTLKCILLTNAHTINAGTQQYYADISANECVGGGAYTTGGILVTTGLTSGYSGNNAYVDTMDASYPGVTLTARYAAIYDSATGSIMAQYNLGGDVTCTGGTLNLTWNASGILTIS